VDPVNWDENGATFLSEMCAISYCPTESIQAWNCADCDQSFNPPSVSVTTDSKQLLSYVTDNSQDTIIVVFKGTDPLSWSDWITDIDTFFTDVSNICSGCQAHAGFYGDYTEQQASVDDALSASLSNLPSATVIITGHSLGAAIAQFYALHLYQSMGIEPIVYTFGNPRIGNQALSSYYDSVITTSYRTNNNCDIVPHLPPNVFGFVQAGTLVFCTDDTNCDVMPGAENDGGLFHTSVTDHGHYLGINYFSFISVGGQSSCDPA
jgi:triacylglycerol lipase